jgi:hypothetical protein
MSLRPSGHSTGRYEINGTDPLNNSDEPLKSPVPRITLLTVSVADNTAQTLNRTCPKLGLSTSDESGM